MQGAVVRAVDTAVARRGYVAVATIIGIHRAGRAARAQKRRKQQNEKGKNCDAFH